ncbi:NHLP leader peptide family RiPP precursor [Paenibacillus sp. GCM10027628]|uniref:NHLP leader peptide family RiPP precursor n=1 Tax=Paenibacillus sp. GCM10027628 TaxID=3273413 RepID=UPI003625390F
MSAEQILKTKIVQKALQDTAFKNHLVSDPKGALKKAFNIEIPDNVEIKIAEETNSQLILVLPANPTEILDITESPRSEW